MITKYNLENIKDKKILGIGAHPDDLEFCAAGTLLKLSKSNHITTLVVTDGRMGTHDENLTNGQLTAIRNEENKTAARMMGVKRDLYWNYPDFSLKNYKKNLDKRILLFLLKTRPDIVITFDPWGRYEPAVHPDHRTISMTVVESILASTLPLHLKKIGYKGKFLSPKPQLWLMAPASPNVAVDISGEWEKKWEILASHKSQFDEQVNFDKMKARVAAVMSGPYAEQIGVTFAEPFRIMEYSGEEAD